MVAILTPPEAAPLTGVSDHHHVPEVRSVGKGVLMSGLIRFLARIFVVSVVLKRLRGDPEGERSPRPPAPPSGRDAGAIVTPPNGRGESPDSPLDLQASDWKATFKRTLKEIKKDRITLVAAGMAFYFFLAIFPALIAFIGILGLVEIDSSGVVDALRRNMPGGSGAVLVDAVRAADNASESASLVAALVGIATAVWSASSGMVALQAGLDVAYDIPEERKFIAKRGVALSLVIASGLLGAVPSPFFTFGDGLVFSVLGWVLTLVSVMLLFALYYYVGPNRSEKKWQWVSAGGIVGAVLWVLASLGFGYYAGNFGSYSKTYGPLAGVIILIFWLYLSSLSVLVGGELNAEFERQGKLIERRNARR
jgi:membrane protein